MCLSLFPPAVALQKLLSTVLPSFQEAVRQEHERQVVMAVLESMNGVLKCCQGEALRPAGRLGEISQVIRSVLNKKVRGEGVRSEPPTNTQYSVKR